MLRFTVSGQDAPVKCIQSDGGCGFVFTARVSRVVFMGILFVDVLDVCHIDKCLLLHKHASKCISGHQASPQRQATRVESRRWLETMQFAAKHEDFLQVHQLFLYDFLNSVTENSLLNSFITDKITSPKNKQRKRRQPDL